MRSASLATLADRRRLLGWLCASPLAFPGSSLLAQGRDLNADPRRWTDFSEIIASPDEALNVFDFELAMQAKTPPGHFGYMATGIDGETTLRANREAFRHYHLRGRRMRDVSGATMATNLLGQRLANPIVLAPTGAHKAFYPEGELAVARAARAGDHLLVLSTSTTTSIEQVIEARGAPVWFQLSFNGDWRVATGMAKRAERAGSPVLMLTVDRAGGGRNLETHARLARRDTPDCDSCRGRDHFEARVGRFAMYEGLPKASGSADPATLDWSDLKRLRDVTAMKIVLKGIITGEDAALACEHGVDGIVVSNHGARSEDGGPGTIDVLAEVIAAVQGRIPVMIDGGFRRGSDIVKALCMGAAAVQVGRPYLWGLGAFGQPGVEKVLELLRGELLVLMKQMGAASLADLTPTMVRTTYP